MEQKEEMVRRPFQNSTAFVDSTGICLFTKFAITHREICALLAPATGIDFLLIGQLNKVTASGILNECLT